MCLEYSKNKIKRYNRQVLPALLHGIENLTITARDARRVTAAEMKYMRKTEGYTGTDCKTNTEIATELNISPVLDKILGYRRNWIRRVNRMPRHRLPRIMIIKKIHTERHKKPEETVEETSGCVRLERVHKWPNSMMMTVMVVVVVVVVVMMMMMMMMMMMN